MAKGVTETATMAGWQAEFIERFGLIVEAGFPRSTARVLGWLIVCEPPHQSADQLQSMLHLSAGSVSSAVALLIRVSFVERITFPGDRRTYYRLAPGGWNRAIHERARGLTAARVVAENALRDAGRHPRLEELRDVYAWWEARFADLVEAYDDATKNQRAGGALRVRRTRPLDGQLRTRSGGRETNGRSRR